IMGLTIDPTAVTYATRSRGEVEARLAEMIVYISERSAEDPGFGKTKLNKLLRKIDRLAFVEQGEPITGGEYTRQEFGPCPRLFKPVWERMKMLGQIATEKRRVFGRDQQRAIPRRTADLSMFTAD